MSEITQASSVKKSALSIVIISSITAGVIALDKNQMLPHALSFSNNISNRNIQESSLLEMEAYGPALIAQETLSAEKLIEPVLQAIDENEKLQVAVAHEDAQETDAERPDNSRQSVIDDLVLFAFDSSEISPSYYPSLTETAMLIIEKAAQQELVWQVVGYADSTGNQQYNYKLAAKRAQAVAQFLVNKGVAEAQLEILSLGDKSAQQAQLDKAELYLQRRVEIHPYQAEIATTAKQQKHQHNARLALPAESGIAQGNIQALQTSARQKTAEPLVTVMEL